METEVRQRILGRGLSNKEKEFLQAYINQRPDQSASFTKEETRTVSSQLREIDGIDRSVGAVYMQLRRLSASEKEISESSKEKILNRFQHHLRKLEKCFKWELNRRFSKGGNKIKILEKEAERLKKELKETQDELRRLTPLREALENIQKKETQRRARRIS